MAGLGEPGRGGGDLSALREQNARSVLGLILAEPRRGLTQPELVAATGLSRTTISTILTHDLKRVLESNDKSSTRSRGRPSKAFRVRANRAFTLGADVGLTHIRAGLFDATGELLLDSAAQPAKAVLRKPHQVLAQVMDAMLALLEDHGVNPGAVSGIGIGLPGAVQRDLATMVDDAAAAWRGLNVADEIRKRWPFPHTPGVVVDNEAAFGALAEFHRGAGRGATNLLTVKWASGVGGGLILGSALWGGSTGVAAELGHVPVRPTRAQREILGLKPRSEVSPCPRCGHIDCLELAIGGRRLARAAGVANFPALLREAADPAGASSASREVLRVAAEVLGCALGPAVTMLNVERVVVGGQMTHDAYPVIVEPLGVGLKGNAFPAAARSVGVEVGQLGGTAPMTGAAIEASTRLGLDFLLGLAGATSPPARPLAKAAG